MNKIASYLSQHLSGEVSSAQSLRKLYANDGSILNIAPEIIAFPRVTNDIRKIARFTWQLAEKGHIVAMTVRGFGGDVTGAAVGKGIVVDTSRQLNSILEVAAKDKLVHVQPGVSLTTLEEALKWQGLALRGAQHRGSIRDVSVGGAIANDSLGVDGSVSDAIKKLEVILANGDVIETGKLNKREISKKLGLQTFEGEIYRKLEGLIEDNDELIKQMVGDTTRDNTGYKRIAEVRSKDGSFDLTPLFIGSQGTLGIISEVVLKTEFYALDETMAVIVTESIQVARDLGERLQELEAAELRVVDGALLRRAAKNGAAFNLLGSVDKVGAVVFVRFNDFSTRAQDHKLKKLRKLMKKTNLDVIDSTEREPSDFRSITNLARTLQLSASDDRVAMPIINGASIPTDRYEDFEIAVEDLASKHHIELPLELDAIAGTYNIYPLLELGSVADKQKIFKLMTDYATIVDRCNGAFTADGAEGRLKANAAWALLDDKHADLYEQVRGIFDPFGTLNPGVKQKGELRALVGALRTNFDSSSVL